MSRQKVSRSLKQFLPPIPREIFSFKPQPIPIPGYSAKIVAILFWNFTMFDYKFHSPQAKQSLISSIKT